MESAVIQIVTAAVGTLGFCLCFGVRSRYLAAAAGGGLLSWTLYLLFFRLSGSVFAATLGSAMLVGVWAELMARLQKAPATTFLIPGILPLLPGGALYATMVALLNKELETFTARGVETATVTLGLSAGLVMTSVLFRYVLGLIERRRAARTPQP